MTSPIRSDSEEVKVAKRRIRKCAEVSALINLLLAREMEDAQRDLMDIRKKESRDE